MQYSTSRFERGTQCSDKLSCFFVPGEQTLEDGNAKTKRTKAIFNNSQLIIIIGIIEKFEVLVR